MKLFSIGILALLLSSCSPGLMLCLLDFSGQEKTYHFDYSKEQLKDQLLDTYTYDRSLLVKNLGATLIQDEAVNTEYLIGINEWLYKNNWSIVEPDIRDYMGDTLNLIIRKHHRREKILLRAIIEGNGEQSSITLSRVRYTRRNECTKIKEIYEQRVWKKIDKKLVKRLY